MLQRLVRAPLVYSSHIPKRLFPHPRLANPTFYQGRQTSRSFHSKPSLRSAEKEGGATASQSPKSTTPNEQQAQPEAPEHSRVDEIESLKRENIDLKDKYLRSVADSQNLQDRTKRDVDSAHKFAISGFAKDLIDTVDDLDRALAAFPASGLAPSTPGDTPAPNQDVVNLYDGIKSTQGTMLRILAKHGLERYDPAQNEEKFNPNLHEASFMAPQKDKEDGTVFTTVQKGFSLNGRIIRAAKVGVVKNS